MNTKPLRAVSLLFIVALNVLAQPQPGTLVWSFNTGALIRSSPALAEDGTLYLASGNALLAITNSTSSASNKWVFTPSPGPLTSGSASLAADGTIYFGSGRYFYALNPNGSPRWTMDLSNSVCNSTPAIAMDNTIYFVAAGKLFAMTPSGSNKWQTVIDTSNYKNISPVIGPDGTVYANGYETRTLHAINPDGTEKWALPLSDAAGEASAIGQDGAIYLTAFSMAAVSRAGTLRWQNPFRVNTAPVIGPDGTLYAGGIGLGVAAFTPDGQEKWYALDYAYPAFPTTPAVGASGTIYHCVSNALYALTPQGAARWAFASSDPTSGNYQTFSAPTIGPDGTIYAAFGTTLYAIASGGDKPANSTWPMYQQNSRHTGRIERPALNKLEKRADANFQFQIYDQLGNTNAIQTSPDLAIWSPLTNVVITNVPLDFVDLEASNFTRRFYRAVQQ